MRRGENAAHQVLAAQEVGGPVPSRLHCLPKGGFFYTEEEEELSKGLNKIAVNVCWVTLLIVDMN